MSTNITTEPPSTTVDLTGLPEPVVDDIKRLVRTLRDKMPSAVPASGRHPLLGIFADQKLSIPKEQIDAAQAEAWSGFPRELPKGS